MWRAQTFPCEQKRLADITAASKLQSIGRGFLVRSRRVHAHIQDWMDYTQRISQLYDEPISPQRMSRDPRDSVDETYWG